MGTLGLVTYDGYAPAELAARLKCPQCVVLDRTPSTNDVLSELAEQAAPAGTVVIADEQIEGRGRGNNRWHSIKGRGVLLSFLVRPKSAMPTGVLALRVGLVVLESLDTLGVEAKLKWPNDIVVGGLKVCGILCEARWDGNEPRWVVVGIGLNVHGPLPEPLRARATVLEAHNPGVTRVQVLERLVPGLRAMSMDTQLTARELESHARHDWLTRRRIVQPIDGVVCGVASDGALLVQSGTGLERIVGGHIVTT